MKAGISRAVCIWSFRKRFTTGTATFNCFVLIRLANIKIRVIEKEGLLEKQLRDKPLRTWLGNSASTCDFSQIQFSESLKSFLRA